MKLTGLLFLLTLAQVDPSPDPVEVVRKAAEAYRRRDYREAGDLFVRAYRLTEIPVQLRNAAKAYEDGELWSEALDAWAEYRTISSLGSTEQAEAEMEIASIERQRVLFRKAEEEVALVERQRARSKEDDVRRARLPEPTEDVGNASSPVLTEPSPSALVVPESRAAKPLYGAWVTAGAGVTALVAAGIVALHADSRVRGLDDRLAMVDGQGHITGIRQMEAVDELSAINVERNAAVVTAGVGAVALLTGVLWWMLAEDGR